MEAVHLAGAVVEADHIDHLADAIATQSEATASLSGSPGTPTQDLPEYRAAMAMLAKAGVGEAGARHQARDWLPRGSGGTGRAGFFESAMGTRNNGSAGHRGVPSAKGCAV